MSKYVLTPREESDRLARMLRATRATHPCKHCGERIKTKGGLSRHEKACGKFSR